MDRNKKLIVTSSVFCALSVINAIVYIALIVSRVLPSEGKAYFMLVSSVAVFWAPVLIEKIFKIKWNYAVVLVFDVFVSCALIAGAIWNVYAAWFYFDKIIHFASGIVAAMIAYNLFNSSKKGSLSLPWLFVLAFSASMAIGGIWEICEFTFDGLFGDNTQRWMDLVGREVLMDTMKDLICDCCGSVLGGVCVILLERRRLHK